MADSLTPEAEEELLALIDPFPVRLDLNRTERDQLLADRAAVFLKIREQAPGISMKRIAARAGVSDAAVVQQLERARTAREAADEPLAEAGP